MELVTAYFRRCALCEVSHSLRQLATLSPVSLEEPEPKLWRRDPECTFFQSQKNTHLSLLCAKENSCVLQLLVGKDFCKNQEWQRQYPTSIPNVNPREGRPGLRGWTEGLGSCYWTFPNPLNPKQMAPWGLLLLLCVLVPGYHAPLISSI